jgi:hypothetical protein
MGLKWGKTRTNAMNPGFAAQSLSRLETQLEANLQFVHRDLAQN